MGSLPSTPECGEAGVEACCLTFFFDSMFGSGSDLRVCCNTGFSLDDSTSDLACNALCVLPRHGLLPGPSPISIRYCASPVTGFFQAPWCFLLLRSVAWLHDDSSQLGIPTRLGSLCLIQHVVFVSVPSPLAPLMISRWTLYNRS
ncbi:unnamed protein product [Calypogeia fissa]